MQQMRDATDRILYRHWITEITYLGASQSLDDCRLKFLSFKSAQKDRQRSQIGKFQSNHES